MSIQPIVTERLILTSLSTDVLVSLAEGDVDAARRLVDYQIPRNCSLLGWSGIHRRVGLMSEDGAQCPWMYRAIVRKSDRRMIGNISFHHKAPDPDLSEYCANGVELGYTIDPDYRRKGYAKESAIGMMDWANRKYGVSEFILTISPENLASLEMAKSMNFKVVGEWTDPVDGLEFIMKAGIEEILNSKMRDPIGS